MLFIDMLTLFSLIPAYLSSSVGTLYLHVFLTKYRMSNAHVQGPDISTILTATPPFPWEHSNYLSPVLTDDPLLQLDFEPSADDSESGPTICGEGGKDLTAKVSELEKQVEHYREALTRAHLDLEHMRSCNYYIVLWELHFVTNSIKLLVFEEPPPPPYITLI